MISRKKVTLSFFESERREWVTLEIGAPPFDVPRVAYLLSGMDSFKSRHHLESDRRTLEAMINDGLLQKITSYEQRQQGSTQSGTGKGVWCNSSRYGLQFILRLLSTLESACLLALAFNEYLNFEWVVYPN